MSRPLATRDVSSRPRAIVVRRTETAAVVRGATRGMICGNNKYQLSFRRFGRVCVRVRNASIFYTSRRSSVVAVSSAVETRAFYRAGHETGVMSQRFRQPNACGGGKTRYYYFYFYIIIIKYDPALGTNKK